MKREQVNNVTNIKNGQGHWLKGYTIKGVRYQTRSCILWNNINLRCKPDGAHQKRRPTYIGATNDFKSFEDFVDWCEESYGVYEMEDCGEYWALDKDILMPGNMSYNPESCLFVPKDVNIIFQNKSKATQLPRGVVKRLVDTKLPYIVGYTNPSTGSKTSKCFSTEESAHRFWQENRINLIRGFLKTPSLSQHLKLLTALEYRLSLLEYDYENFIKTKTM